MAPPTPRSGLLTLAPYVGGASSVAGIARPTKLSSNEGAFGPSPAALAAYRAAAGNLHRYPNGGAEILKDAIVERLGIPRERIVCGAGSDDIIQLLCHAYLEPGDHILYSRHGFLIYKIAAIVAGGVADSAPERALTADVDALLAAVGPRTKMVFIANPNNPTGTYLSREEIARLRDGLPEHVLLVLDAAYCEFVRRNDYEAGHDLARTADNIVVTRTFSKVYGLAGLRVGWGDCPPAIADVLNRIRAPFNVNAPGQVAAAAALRDTAFLDASIAHNEVWRDWLAEALAEIGLTPVPGVANFLLIPFPDAPGRRAADADAFLKARGLILRRVDAYGLPGCLRVTVGLAEENRAVVAALAEFMKGTDGA